jgi:hypothetical protein
MQVQTSYVFLAVNLPLPRAKLAGCMWLARIVTKARLYKAHSLPAEYAERFCHPTGVDNQFLQFLGWIKILSLKPPVLMILYSPIGFFDSLKSH